MPVMSEGVAQVVCGVLLYCCFQVLISCIVIVLYRAFK